MGIPAERYHTSHTFDRRRKSAQETAWFVIYPADEYNIVNRQGFTATEFTFVEPYFDYISIEKNPLKIEGFYFNVKKLLKEYNRKFYER